MRRTENGRKKELKGIERKSTELLPEHKKMQMKSQKLQSFRDKQRNHIKTARDCEEEEEMQTINEEWEEQKAHYETRFRVLGKCGSRIGE